MERHKPAEYLPAISKSWLRIFSKHPKRELPLVAFCQVDGPGREGNLYSFFLEGMDYLQVHFLAECLKLPVIRRVNPVNDENVE